jgi:hypothetical protein
VRGATRRMAPWNALVSPVVRGAARRLSASPMNRLVSPPMVYIKGEEMTAYCMEVHAAFLIFFSLRTQPHREEPTGRLTVCRPPPLASPSLPLSLYVYISIHLSPARSLL